MPQPTSKARLVITALFVDHQSPAEAQGPLRSRGRDGSRAPVASPQDLPIRPTA